MYVVSASMTGDGGQGDSVGPLGGRFGLVPQEYSKSYGGYTAGIISADRVDAGRGWVDGVDGLTTTTGFAPEHNGVAYRSLVFRLPIPSP